MRAVTFQAPNEVRVEDVPEPQLLDAGDAIVRIEATGVCGSDLHIYHGRVKIEPGFTIGHEYVGTVLAAGDDVHDVAVGDRVLGCFQTACGHCFFCRRGLFHKCDSSRTFGHGAALGSLQGTQAEQALVPSADLVLRARARGHERRDGAVRRRRDGHRLPRDRGLRAAMPGDTVAVLGLGPVGLCAVQAARACGAAQVIAVDSVARAPGDGRDLRRAGRAPGGGRPPRRGARGHRGAWGGRVRRRRRAPARRSIWRCA